MSGDPISRIDPLGLAEQNFFDPDNPHDSQTRAGADAWNPSWAYAVGGHGNFINMEDRRDGVKIIYPWQLAEIIRKDPRWKGRPIILGSCNTGRPRPDGKPNFAQQLANYLGVDVTAPTDFVWYDANGMRGSGPYPSGPPSGTIGPWKSFSPMSVKR